MNILITSFSFPSLELGHYDGKFVLAEAKAYAENGASVKILTPHYSGAKKKELLQERIEIIRFSYFLPQTWQRLKQPGKPIYDSKSLPALLQIPILLALFSCHILRLSKWADIIHAQWTVTALLALPAKFIAKTPVVMTARGSDLRLLPNWLNRFIHRHVDGVIDCFGPQPMLNKYKNLFRANYIKLPLIVSYSPEGAIPVDMKKIVLSTTKPFIILYIGRYVALKLKKTNLFMDLIAAAPLMKNKFNFHIFFIGDGEDTLLAEMEKRIQDGKVLECVTMLGAKININEYLAWAHLGLGGKALNAVSQEFFIAGIPQMMGGGDKDIDSIWEKDRNVLLVEPGNPGQMAEKIINFACSTKLQAKITKNSALDISPYVSNTSVGGKTYLTAFANIIKKKFPS